MQPLNASALPSVKGRVREGGTPASDHRRAVLQRERDRRREERQELIALLRKLLRRAPGAQLLARDLRRMLVLHLGHVPRLSVLGQAMAAIGAPYYRTEAVRGWRNVALAVSPERARRHVIAAWEKRLAAEGLGEIRLLEPEWRGAGQSTKARGMLSEAPGDLCDGIELSTPPTSRRDKRAELLARVAINSGILDQARDYFWTCLWSMHPRRDRAVWERWAIEGQPVRDIAEALGLPKSTVQDVLTRHKARAGILGR